MNTFLNTMSNNTNYGYTENGALTRNTTRSDVLDLFALGGAMRNRSDADCINMFKNAMAENANLAIKCLFYLADCRGGQGERRFFRVCYKWLANNYEDIARKNLNNIPVYRRWDDLLYATEGTPVFNDALSIVAHQLALDVDCKTPSLCAKWMPSENASSKTTKAMAAKVSQYLGLSHKRYRVLLSTLRSRINIVEKLMSQGKWNQIQFDKIPSKAGLIYRNAFAKHDFDRYNEFMQNKDTTVKASVLNPVDIAHQAFYAYRSDLNDPTRIMLNKAWENLPDYYNGREENGLCVVDVSGSMSGQPMEAAVSLGAYIAERGHGPFANHFITFSRAPQLVRFEGVDIVDKFNRCRKADWGYNTDIEAVFDLLLRTAQSRHTNPKDIPTRLYILSDMQFDRGICGGHSVSEGQVNTLLENIAQKWAAAGYELPQVVFWNLRACDNAIPAIGGRFSYVSGFSPAILDAVLSGKTGMDMCLEKLLSDRYKSVTV